MVNKVFNTALLVALLVSYSFQNTDLKTANLSSKRVKEAYKKHWGVLKTSLDKMDVNANDFELFIRAFKEEKTMEVWVKNTSDKSYKLYKSFAVCASSGIPGPKRRQGDLQVPEGFYTIPSLHPYSSYHLAMKVSYPNASDKLKKTAYDAGGDIMIHGKCCTVGCIPLQDEPAEELFILCLEVMNRHKTVQCHIFPCRMISTTLKHLESDATKEFIGFWNNIKPGYDFFELNHSLPKVTINKKGDYCFNLK